LSPRFYGHFLVLSKVGSIAYKFNLLMRSLIHPIFHVSQLKLKLGRVVAPITHLPPVNATGVIQPELEEILDRRLQKVHNRALVELLVLWQGQIPEEANWVVFHKLKSSYPHLVGKVF
jgi:hypothetical protein